MNSQKNNANTQSKISYYIQQTKGIGKGVYLGDGVLVKHIQDPRFHLQPALQDKKMIQQTKKIMLSTP